MRAASVRARSAPWQTATAALTPRRVARPFRLFQAPTPRREAPGRFCGCSTGSTFGSDRPTTRVPTARGSARPGPHKNPFTSGAVVLAGLYGTRVTTRCQHTRPFRYLACRFFTWLTSAPCSLPTERRANRRGGTRNVTSTAPIRTWFAGKRWPTLTADVRFRRICPTSGDPSQVAPADGTQRVPRGGPGELGTARRDHHSRVAGGGPVRIHPGRGRPDLPHQPHDRVRARWFRDLRRPALRRAGQRDGVLATASVIRSSTTAGSRWS